MKNWRFAGIDDSFSDDKCCLFGCVTCGGYVEGFMYEEIAVDGLDSTEKIVKMLLRSKFREQLKCVFLGGITFGGFNVADIREIYEKTGIPVIVIMRKMPNMEEFFRAMNNLPNAEKRKSIAMRAGKVYRIASLFVQLAGINVDEAEKYIEIATVKGNIPEPLRIAHLAASAVIHGESKGKA